MIVAGESAGANLVSSLAIQTSVRRDELWARRVFERGVQPAAVIGYSGIFEVSGISRLLTHTRYPAAVREWVEGIESSYLGALSGDEGSALADPVRLLEDGVQLDRPLPPFFLTVGTADPLVEDSERLVHALQAYGVPAELEVLRGRGARLPDDHLPQGPPSDPGPRPLLSCAAGTSPPSPRRCLPTASMVDRVSRWSRERVLDVVAA